MSRSICSGLPIHEYSVRLQCFSEFARTVARVFNDSLVKVLATMHQVRVLSPIPWVDCAKAYRRRIPLSLFRPVADPAAFQIHYVPFFYTPKILRRRYGTFYWSSIAGTVRSLIRALSSETGDRLLGPSLTARRRFGSLAWSGLLLV